MSNRLRPLPWQKLVQIFERDGFTVVRQEGDHLVLTKPSITRPIVIPRYHHVPVFVIRNNLRSAGMSREQFFQLLQQA